MLRKAAFVTFFAVLTVLLSAPAQAQAGAEVTATANLHMQFGAGTNYLAVTIIARGTGMALEARNADISWLLVHTDDGAYRGWIPNQYLAMPSGYNAFTLPFSVEVVSLTKNAAIIAPPTAAPDNTANIAPDTGAPSTGSHAVTVLPTNPSNVTARIRQIYLHGRQLGNHANVYIKLGDSITAYHLLFSFANRGGYELGKFSELQSTISYFNHSLNIVNLTAATGFTSVTEMDATWSDPQFCNPGEALLPCEIRRSKPSIALIYLGPNDMDDNPLDVYASHLAQDVQVLIDHGVIPVLYTFAIRGDRFPDRAPQYEAVIRSIAAQQHVPLIDFYEAAKTLPDNGVVADAFHMTHRDDWAVHFTGDESKYGETLLELYTLQMLDQIRRSTF